MGSKTFEGVWFTSFSHDHAPAHVHGRYGEVTVVVDLLPGGVIRQAERWDAVQPANAKRSDVRHVLHVAGRYGAELMEVWERTHGAAK